MFDYFVVAVLGAIVCICVLGLVHARRKKVGFAEGLVSALGAGGRGTPEDEGP